MMRDFHCHAATARMRVLASGACGARDEAGSAAAVEYSDLVRVVREMGACSTAAEASSGNGGDDREEAATALRSVR